MITIAAAAVIGFGVPLAWVWIGSQLQSGEGATTVSFTVAIVILFGIIASYVAVLYIAGLVMAALERDDDEAATSRSPWMRGMTDTRQRARRNTIGAVERIFVITTILVTVAFWLWFAFEAGSPLPSQ